MKTNAEIMALWKDTEKCEDFTPILEELLDERKGTRLVLNERGITIFSAAIGPMIRKVKKAADIESHAFGPGYANNELLEYLQELDRNMNEIMNTLEYKTEFVERMKRVKSNGAVI